MVLGFHTRTWAAAVCSLLYHYNTAWRAKCLPHFAKLTGWVSWEQTLIFTCYYSIQITLLWGAVNKPLTQYSSSLTGCIDSQKKEVSAEYLNVWCLLLRKNAITRKYSLSEMVCLLTGAMLMAQTKHKWTYSTFWRANPKAEFFSQKAKGSQTLYEVCWRLLLLSITSSKNWTGMLMDMDSTIKLPDRQIIAYR